MRARTQDIGAFAHQDDCWGWPQRVGLLVRSALSHGLVREVVVAMRPSLPPVLLTALCVWGTCAAFFTVMRAASTILCWALLVISLAGVIASCIFLTRKGAPLFLSCLCLGISVGLAAASFGAISLHTRIDEVSGGDIQIVSIEMSEDARPGSYGSYGIADAIDTHGATYRVQVQFGETSCDDLALFGEKLAVSGQLEPTSDEYGESSWQKGVCATLSVGNASKVERNDAFGILVSIRSNAISAIRAATGSEDAKAVLEALVCGYRVDLSDAAIYDSFKVDGLAHLVAVSGAHLSLVSMMLAVFLTAFKLPRKLTAMLQSVLIAAFLVFAGMPISAIRAALMTCAGIFSFLVHRRASSLNALGLCILVLVIVDPIASVSVSFVLSALSVLGIAVFSPLFRGWIADFRQPILRDVGESVAVTMAASMLSAPYSACLFNQLPLVSPLANLVAAPLFTLVCGLGVASALASSFVPDVGKVFLDVAVAACDVLCQCVKALANMPHASIPFVGDTTVALVLTVIVAFTLWARWPKLRALGVATASLLAVSAAVCITLVAPVASGVQIVALDVGQGDAILLRDGTSAVLVDTGNQDQKLLAALARNGIYHLDAVVITHGDDDHMGSLEALAGIVSVDHVVVCEFAQSCSCSNCVSLVRSASALVGEDNVVGVSAGSKIALRSFTLDVIWPKSFSDEGGNADSLCMVIDADVDYDGSVDARAFLCGDAEDEQLDEMVESGELGKVDIYKVGHHGSRKAIDADTARDLSPSIALVSVGADNSYGHPVASTLDALRAAGATIYRTDEQGDLTCNLGADGIRVTTQK